MKRIIIITLLAAILLCGCAEEAAIPKLEIIFFDVGKADSFFMQIVGNGFHTIGKSCRIGCASTGPFSFAPGEPPDIQYDAADPQFRGTIRQIKHQFF